MKMQPCSFEAYITFFSASRAINVQYFPPLFSGFVFLRVLCG
jgi:hypothetical protein